ncbi:MAG: hypothetical protein AAGK14_04630 [Verrucomicrobiota bacterium]
MSRLSLACVLLALCFTLPTLLQAESKMDKAAYEKKLNETVIPKVDFKMITAVQAYSFVAAKCGIPLDASKLKGASTEMNVTLSLNDVPAAEVMLFIATLTMIKAEVTDDGIVLVPPKPAP